MGRTKYSARTVFYGHGIADPATLPAVGAERMTAVSAQDLDDFLFGLSGNDVITFDDGYINNLITALPILEKHNCPATIFVTTGFIAGTHPPMERVVAQAVVAEAVGEGVLASLGVRQQEATARFSAAQWMLMQMPVARRDQWLARLSEACGISLAEATEDYLSVEQLRDFAANPLITIGAHTISHPDLRQADDAELANELAGARAQLEAWIDKPVTSLAYPYGSNDTRVRRAAAVAGYRRAYGTSQPRWRRAWPFHSRFNLPRTDLRVAAQRLDHQAGENTGKQ